MNKIKTILIIFGIVGFVIIVSFFLIGQFEPKEAAINIESTPTAIVFVNGEQVGKTPYEATLRPGEVEVRLVPEIVDVALATYETRVTLYPNIKTIIRRELKETDEASSGETISFEKIGSKEVSLAIVSNPNSAQVSIDGALIGFAPYKTSTITAGEHQIAVSAPGYKERTMAVRTVSGYKLTAVVKLAPSGEVVEQPPSSEPQEPTVSLVEILSTPTGFLRVRANPTTSSEEVGQVTPGERYPYLGTDEVSGWFKIEFSQGKEGWVSDEYAQIVEGVLSPSPTPTTAVN
jgi:hypothetical protein